MVYDYLMKQKQMCIHSWNTAFNKLLLKEQEINNIQVAIPILL